MTSRICSSKHNLVMRGMALAAGLALAAGHSAQAQGIPVIDNTAIAQHIQQLAELRSQLEQAKAIYDKAAELHESFNQITDMGDLAGLLNDPSFQQYLPQEFSQYADAVDGLLQGNIEGLASQYDYYSREGASPANDFYYQELQRRRGETYQDMAVGEVVYDQASQRLEELNQFKDALSTASTPKEVMDLQARIQTESAILQNEVLRMQGLAMIQDARNRVDEQREDEHIEEMNDQIRAALQEAG